MRRMAQAIATAAATLAAAAPASACITVGVYQDNPAASLTALTRSAGSGVTAISTYLTAGKPLSQALINLANRNHASMIVTWNPDGGQDGAVQPGYRLASVAGGRYDKSLRALVGQLQAVKKGAVLRPMPEMNTPWYAWSGTVNGNSPAQFVAAWRRLRRAVQSAPGGRKVKLLWSPYARSVPATSANQIAAYFPGASQVDLVGASAYNFGAVAPLQWTDPGALFYTAYTTIESLASKPFWLAETGSTATGGDEAGWIDALGTLQSTAMPQLAGVVWYDVNDPSGDFRLHGTLVLDAFKTLLKEACR
jgi:mannan endo-1,4-beta-mannosidase